MPRPPDVPSTIRFRLTGTLQNAAAWGVRFYSTYTGGEPTVANMLTLCEGVGTAWQANISAFQATSSALTAIDGVDLSSTDGAGNTADVDYAGEAAFNQLPNQVAAVAKFDIARRYRGGKPKMFVPAITTNAVLDESHFTGAFCDDLGAAMNSFNDNVKALFADSTTLTGIVNVSFYDGFTSVQNPVTLRWRNVPTYRAVALIDVVGGFTVDPVFGTQKRRRLA